MTEPGELEALTQSIGEHAVFEIGEESLRQLTVSVSSADMTSVVTVCLRANDEATQREALEALFAVQSLFFDEVSMSFDFGVVDDEEVAANVKQLQYSFA